MNIFLLTFLCFRFVDVQRKLKPLEASLHYLPLRLMGYERQAIHVYPRSICGLKKKLSEMNGKYHELVSQVNKVYRKNSWNQVLTSVCDKAEHLITHSVSTPDETSSIIKQCLTILKLAHDQNLISPDLFTRKRSLEARWVKSKVQETRAAASTPNTVYEHSSVHSNTVNSLFSSPEMSTGTVQSPTSSSQTVDLDGITDIEAHSDPEHDSFAVSMPIEDDSKRVSTALPIAPEISLSSIDTTELGLNFMDSSESFEASSVIASSDFLAPASSLAPIPQPVTSETSKQDSKPSATLTLYPSYAKVKSKSSEPDTEVKVVKYRPKLLSVVTQKRIHFDDLSEDEQDSVPMAKAFSTNAPSPPLLVTTPKEENYTSTTSDSRILSQRSAIPRSFPPARPPRRENSMLLGGHRVPRRAPPTIIDGEIQELHRTPTEQTFLAQKQPASSLTLTEKSTLPSGYFFEYELPSSGVISTLYRVPIQSHVMLTETSPFDLNKLDNTLIKQHPDRKSSLPRVRIFHNNLG